MAKSVLSIIIETLKKGDADKETIKTLKTVQQSFRDVGVVIGAAVGAYIALDKTVGEAMRTYVAYAAQVKQLQDITGDSAEATSRLIQVTDDFKVSTDDLGKAQKQLATQGLTLSVETLADLSDKYKELNTGSERQLFLSKEFGGRTGQAFAEIMQQGGDAIRSRSAAVQASLILDQQAVDAARDYEHAVDDLHDSITGLKVAVGQEFISPATQFTKWMTDVSESTSMADYKLRVMIRNMEIMPIDNVTQGYIAMARAAETHTRAVEQDAEAVAKANQEYLNLVGQLQQENDNYNQSLDQTNTQLADLNEQIAEAARRYGANSRQVKDLKAQVDDLQATEQERAEQHRQDSRKIALDLLTQRMAIDGLDERETEVLLGLQEKWGFVDDETAAAARKVLQVANNLDDLDGKSIDVAINVALFGAGSGLVAPRRTRLKPGTTAEPVAGGGPLPQGWALVGDAPGGQLTPYSELISPTGYVFNARETKQLIAAGIHPRAFYQGGVGYGDDPLTIGTSQENLAYNQAYYAPYLSTGGAGARKRRTAGGAAGAATVSTAVNTAAVALRAASQGISEQTAQTAEIGAQGNQISKQILAAIDALPERLAAKLAQGRL